MRSYERLGLPELWLVDSPVASVLVFRRSDPQVPEFDVALEITRGELLTSPLLRRFELPVDDIFSPLRSRD
jgi:Uma2 family endonuclease